MKERRKGEEIFSHGRRNKVRAVCRLTEDFAWSNFGPLFRPRTTMTGEKLPWLAFQWASIDRRRVLEVRIMRKKKVLRKNERGREGR